MLNEWSCHNYSQRDAHIIRISGKSVRCLLTLIFWRLDRTIPLSGRQMTAEKEALNK